MLCKTVWSWELRTWSHKLNIIDTSTNSPRYCKRLNKGAFTRHPSKSPVFLKSIRRREPTISKIWCSRKLSKNPAPYNCTFLCFSFLFSEKKFNKIDDEFTKCNTFLVSCLGNIVKRGVFPHCKSFLWRVKNFSSTNLSPSSLDMLESLVLQRSFEPLFTEGMFLSSLCLLFGLKKSARRSASNVTTLAFVVSTLFVVLAFQWKTHENAEALFKMGVRGGVGVKVFSSQQHHISFNTEFVWAERPNASVSKWGKKL